MDVWYIIDKLKGKLILEVLKMKATKVVNVNIYCDVAVWEMDNGKFLIEGDKTEREYNTLEEAKENLSNSIYW